MAGRGVSFYTYAHFRESDGKAFYIGKGKGQRAWAVSRRSGWWQKTSAKHGLKVQILAKWPTEDEAFQHERLLIATFRELRHPLVNLTDGGEGFAGGKHTPETRAAISASSKGRIGKSPSPQHRERIRATLKAKPCMTWLGKKHSPESITKRTASRRETTRKHEDGGMCMTLTEWARHLGMHRSSIEYRIETGKPLLAPKHHKG
jgi:hypothetical protein